MVVSTLPTAGKSPFTIRACTVVGSSSQLVTTVRGLLRRGQNFCERFTVRAQDGDVCNDRAVYA
jgi:hypothetical protein